MKNPVSNKVVCTYYRCNRSQEIFCAGIQEGTRIHLGFADPGSLKDFMDKNCKSFSENKCPIAEMLAQRECNKIAL